MPVDVLIFYNLDSYDYDDKFRKKMKFVVRINDEDVSNMISAFNGADTKCLKYITTYGYTIFNRMQIDQVVNELNKKDISKLLNKKTLKTIKDTVELILKEDKLLYLVFDGA